jgi:hypothetical protein
MYQSMNTRREYSPSMRSLNIPVRDLLRREQFEVWQKDFQAYLRACNASHWIFTIDLAKRAGRVKIQTKNMGQIALRDVATLMPIPPVHRTEKMGFGKIVIESQILTMRTMSTEHQG